jgi:hypothetical protein
MPSNEDFESYPPGEPKDAAAVSLRAYVAAIPREKLAAYSADWTDEQVMEWDGNFKSDGTLMLVCCERDVEVEEFRRTIDLYIRYLIGPAPIDEFLLAGSASD